MKTLRHLADYTLLEHIGYRRHADDAAAFEARVRKAAALAMDYKTINEALTLG